jgi:enediyne biosynthesis protein E4
MIDMTMTLAIWKLVIGISLWLGVWTLELPARAAASVVSSNVAARPLTVPSDGRPGFTLLESSATGVLFTNTFAQERHLTNQIFLNGSGVACGDVDADGWTDLYFSALETGNRLFRNRGGWRFEDVTAQSGVARPNVASTAAAFADFDGDGDVDLIVNSIGAGTHIFFNDGKGRFKPSGQTLNPNRAGMSLAIGDIEGDGDLDFYIANYRTTTLRDEPNTRFNFRMINGQPHLVGVGGRPLTDPDLTNRFTWQITANEQGGTFGHEENGQPDVLYRNNGKGHFTPVSFTDGTFRDESGAPLKQPPFDWGLSAMFRDINGDLAPDLYVCNDFNSPDRFWINDGRGQFRAIASTAVRSISFSSMGVDFADINRDGFDDFIVLDMLSRDHTRRHAQRTETAEQLPVGAIEARPQVSRNTLFLNRGDGTYAEIAQLGGVDASEWSWTPIFLDVDLDGYEDLLVSTGFERDNMNVDILNEIERRRRQEKLSTMEVLHLRKMFPQLRTPNLAFRNERNLTFSECSANWGFDLAAISLGMALADFDRDGDLDVVINNFNAPAALLRNNSSAPRVAVRLQGATNSAAIGAKIRVTGGPVPQSQEMLAGGRYLSSDEPLRVFAAGALTNILSIEVTWREGSQTRVDDVKPNHLYSLMQPGPGSKESVKPTTRQPMFADVSHLVAHSHTENAFDDFALQPLLPKKLSQAGPAVSWFDVNSDGWDDLIIGSGKGGSVAVFRNEAGKRFVRSEPESLKAPAIRDEAAILGLVRSNNLRSLLVASDNYEDATGAGPGVRDYSVQSAPVKDLLPAQASSFGPMALGDIDGDGDLDLFVGGRAVASHYPEPASSLLLRWQNGAFEVDPESKAALTNVGLVNGAIFTDLDGDGSPELVLACDAGSIRVYRPAAGRLTELTRDFGFEKYRGFWMGVSAGDFDGDGRLDIVASNLGRNSKYEKFKPLKLHYGDLDQNGSIEIIESTFNKQRGGDLPLQSLDIVSAAMPILKERFPKVQGYAEATLAQVYGTALSSVRAAELNWLDSTVFLNRGATFEPRPLPIEAQFAPAS